MEDLVLLAKRRDADAFTELMQSQMQNMYKTARALLENDEDAADAISDTILACWEKLDQLKNPEYFRTWMTRILINKCNDILRKKKELYLMGDKPQEIPFSPQEYDNVEWLETLKSLPYCITLKHERRIQIMRNNNTIESLQRDIVIPDIVQQKANLAFAQIKNEHTHTYRKPVKRIRRKAMWASIAAAGILFSVLFYCSLSDFRSIFFAVFSRYIISSASLT